jgi:hypothetical protein
MKTANARESSVSPKSLTAVTPVGNFTIITSSASPNKNNALVYGRLLVGQLREILSPQNSFWIVEDSVVALTIPLRPQRSFGKLEANS